MTNKKKTITAIAIVVVGIILAFLLKGLKNDVAVNLTGNSFALSSEDEFYKLREDNKPKIFMFGTNACSICKEMKPYVKELSEKYNDKIDIKYIDAQEFSNLSAKYRLKGVPAFILQNSDNTGFTPSQDRFNQLVKNNNNPMAFSEDESGKHHFTMLYGYMDKSLFEEIIGDMIGNAE